MKYVALLNDSLLSGYAAPVNSNLVRRLLPGSTYMNTYVINPPKSMKLIRVSQLYVSANRIVL